MRERVHWIVPQGGIACGRKKGRFDSDVESVDCLACRSVWRAGPPAPWKVGLRQEEDW